MARPPATLVYTVGRASPQRDADFMKLVNWYYSAMRREAEEAVYNLSAYARDGGLLSYGPDPVDNWRRAASYVDRILRGEKPGDLPVQLPMKYEMILNRKTATALGLAIPHRYCCAPTR